MNRRLPIQSMRCAALVVLAAASMPALALDAAPSRHCMLLAAEYESHGTSDTNVTDALRANVRPVQAKLLERMQADRLVANTVFINVDSRAVGAGRLARIRQATGCDTVVELRNIFWSASFGAAFGFDVIVNRDAGGSTTTLYSRQYRYGVDQATIESFSNDAFAEAAWTDLRQAVSLDGDREGKPVDPAAVRAEYDRLAAAWPKSLLEYHLRHILFWQVSPADGMIARLHAKDAPDFAKLAAESSEDKATAANGGDVGWLTLQQLPIGMAAAIRANDGKPGLVDRPVQAPDGWHVIEVLDSRPSHAPPFADVAGRLAASLRWTAVVPAPNWMAAQREQ